MRRSYEYGEFQGLGIFPGEVLRLQPDHVMGRGLKVPEIGWNQVFRSGMSAQDPWAHTPLQGLPDGFFQYFNHSYFVKLTAGEMCIATTHYGNSIFCSACADKNIIGLQFHPERSGGWGIQIYRNLANWIAEAGKR
jgi:glutamine amidotransferase